MSHTLMLDKIFLLQYMKECFIKVAQAMCNCHQQKDTSITSYKEDHNPKKYKFFYIPTKLMKCCHWLPSLLQDNSLEKDSDLQKQQNEFIKIPGWRQQMLLQYFAMGSYWTDFSKSLNVSNYNFLVYRISIWGNVPVFCTRQLKLQQTPLSFFSAYIQLMHYLVVLIY